MSVLCRVVFRQEREERGDRRSRSKHIGISESMAVYSRMQRLRLESKRCLPRWWYNAKDCMHVHDMGPIASYKRGDPSRITAL